MKTVRMPESESLLFMDSTVKKLEQVAYGVSLDRPSLKGNAIVAVTSGGEYLGFEKDRLFWAQKIDPNSSNHGIILSRKIEGVQWKGNWKDTVDEYNNHYRIYKIIAFVEI